MKMHPDTEARVRDALRDVTRQAQRAEQGPDTEATRKALRDVSWAVIHAHETLNAAERETREAALNAIQGKAA